MSPVEKVLEALRRIGHEPKRSGKGWMARCPAHDDHTPSLSIGEGDDGSALLKCHAGCVNKDVVVPMSLTLADLMPDRPGGNGRGKVRPPAKPLTIYPTPDDAFADVARRAGALFVTGWSYPGDAARVGRFALPDGRKTYRPICRNGEGWSIGDPPGLWPLYRVDELPSSGPVHVLEGEKCADAAWTVGLPSVTSAHGALSPDKTDWRPLAGRAIVIFPDNDKSGFAYAERVASILMALGCTVRIVYLPNLPESGDIVDWLSADGPMDCKTGDEVKAVISSLVAATEPLKIEPPRPAVEAFQPFPVEILPEPLRSFVAAGAKALGCDPSFLALPLLSGLASAIGNSRRIQLKRTWHEPAILWTTIIGDSGTLKSPALELALRAVRTRQGKAMREHAKAMEQYQDDLVAFDREMAQWKHSKCEGDPPVKPTEPVADRCWCDDSTVEALAVLLVNQPRGLLMVRDELSGWVGGFDCYRQGKGGDVAKWLEMFGGRPMLVDRKAHGPLYIPRAAVSITGGIQPETFRRALRQEYRDNGLAARLLMAWPPRKAKKWTEAVIDPQVEAAVEAVFERLYELAPTIREDGEPVPVDIALTPEGKQAWVEFFDAHAAEHAELTGDLSAAWSKLEGGVARLALVIHLARWAAGDATLATVDAVDEQSIAAGVALARWFGQEARRVYGMLGESEVEAMGRRLMELIRQKGGRISVRDLMRCSRDFTTAEGAETALEALAKGGYGRWEEVAAKPQGGRPTRRFVLADSVDVDKTHPKPDGNDGSVNVNGVNAPEPEQPEPP